MPVTLSDEQLAELKARLEIGERARQIAEGATQIWNDPALSDRAKALWKEKFPDHAVPEYDAEQRVYQRLDKEKREREEAEKRAREQAEEQKWRAQRDAVQKKHGFTDEAMTRLEALMTERNVGDYEVAASYLASQEPSPSEGTADYDRQFWNHERTPEYKEIATDPEGYARREILRSLRNEQNRSRT